MRDGVRGDAASVTGGTAVPVISPVVSAKDPPLVAGGGWLLSAAILAMNPPLAASTAGGAVVPVADPVSAVGGAA